jgi:hypothetical protein
VGGFEHATAISSASSVDEAGALLPDIEARNVLEPQRALHEHSRAGEIEVR